MTTESRPPAGATFEERRAWFCEQTISQLGAKGERIAAHFRELPEEEFYPLLEAMLAFTVAVKGVEAVLPPGSERDLVVRNLKTAYSRDGVAS